MFWNYYEKYKYDIYLI